MDELIADAQMETESELFKILSIKRKAGKPLT
jgi:hypothetical protein